MSLLIFALWYTLVMGWVATCVTFGIPVGLGVPVMLVLIFGPPWVLT